MGSSGRSGGGAGFLGLLPFILIILIIYFLMIRPQSKKQREHKMMLDNLRKGDRVITAGGIIGIIVGMKEKENTVVLKLGENVKIEILKTSISKIIEKSKG